ncbi:biopolymer transporter ExbD [Crenobacter intestini]|uniref:Protein TolR n=1 Tax=Crenobacter intestini TaxID=2563443 RepID=A0A4T0V4K1_9NEIS|nr:biopolymer transporter ExbD [Crenobacter intestini]TIC86175.1 protein TolR [Crenobacter intestini]
MLNRKPRRMINQMNVVPYIDVMLVLLVIFMVTAPMFSPGVIEVPSVSRAAQVDVSPVEVRFDGGRYGWALDGKSHDAASLDALVAAVAPLAAGGRPVAISASRDARYSEVVAIADRLYQAGVSRVALTVRQDG